MKIFIQKVSLISDVMLAVAKDDGRPQICGFSVEAAPNGTLLLIGTDGHKMFVLNDPEGHVVFMAKDERPVILMPPGMMRAIERSKDMLTNLSIETKGGSTIATLYDGQMPLLQAWNVRVDAEFPDWKRCIPFVDQDKPLVQACFNLSVLDEFGKLTAKSKSSLRLFGNKEDGAFIVKIAARDDFFGVVMPSRDMGTADLPNWYTGADLPPENEAPAWERPDFFDDPEVKAAAARAEAEFAKSQTSMLQEDAA